MDTVHCNTLNNPLNETVNFGCSNSYVSMFGRMTRRKTAQTLQLVDGALCTFADTLEVLPGYAAFTTRMLHLESVLTGRMLGMMFECSVSRLHDAFAEAGLYQLAHKLIEARVYGMSAKLKLSQVAMCSCICQALGSSHDMCGVLMNCQTLNPGMWEHFEPTLREQIIALGTCQVRPGGLFSAGAWCNIAKVVVILDTFRCVCFASCQVPVYS